jgi:hypothetical protein
MNLRIDGDAFSAGQIKSKIWAAQELEKVVAQLKVEPLRITILGGWYALLHFILQLRNNVKIEYCRSYDIDASACVSANIINNAWEIDNWQFRSFPKDANLCTYDDSTNLVINTSTEHFDSSMWFDKIPAGTLCLFQGNDLVIDDHVTRPNNLDHFRSLWPLTTELFAGSKFFEFDDAPYTRYMIIGIK